jgi:hypothetical protein
VTLLVRFCRAWRTAFLLLLLAGRPGPERRINNDYASITMQGTGLPKTAIPYRELGISC